MLKKEKYFEEVGLRPRLRNLKSLFISKSLAKIVFLAKSQSVFF